MPTNLKSPNSNPSGIYVGPAGWSYSDWKGVVYPARHEKEFHEATFLADFFDTIEINTSFYSPLRPDLTAQWLDRIAANPRFLFTAKLWQRFTHEGDTTAGDVKLVRAGFDVLRRANRLGAVLLQFPFSFHNTPDSLLRLNHILDDFKDYPLVVEVRHASWAQKEFYELLHERGVGFCNIDQPVIGRSIKPSERVTSPMTRNMSDAASSAQAACDRRNAQAEPRIRRRQVPRRSPGRPPWDVPPRSLLWDCPQFGDGESIIVANDGSPTEAFGDDVIET